MNWPEDFLETPAFDLVARAVQSQLIGTMVSHYRIEERIGSGGMGIVYRARDTRLQRDVALKFLPEAWSADREARAAAGLNHPNICTIHEIGAHDGRPFIAMELLEGRTLKQELGVRSLEMGKVIEIASQIAEALDAAHAQGVIHRDIKPGNIFITARGVVKVLDFGIAVMADSPDSHGGVAIGTRAYMAPEQLQGRAVDARTDIFALGVVIQQMAGKAAAFDRILERCLANDPAARFGSARELRAALHGLRELTFVFADFERRLLERWRAASPAAFAPITSRRWAWWAPWARALRTRSRSTMPRGFGLRALCLRSIGSAIASTARWRACAALNGPNTASTSTM